MVHDKCIGTWEKSKLGGKDDGKITVDPHTGSTFMGTHHNTGAKLENTNCTGDIISFSRVDPVSNDTVTYKNGAISLVGAKHKLKGKFDKKPKVTNAERKARGKTNVQDDPDDWTAEKPT